MSRREDRERALELLYEAGAKGAHPAEVIAALPLAPEPYAQLLANGVADHLDLLDHLIGARAKGWTVDRMAAVDLVVLRLGAFELAFEPDQPEGIVLNEAVELAKRFSTDDSPRFVNGVLAALVADVRGDGPWCHVAHPEALLVDMDGVFRHWHLDAPALRDEVLGLPPGTFARVAFGDDSIRRGNDGTLSHHQWRDEVAARLAEEFGCDPAAVLEAWQDDSYDIDEGAVELARQVRAAGHPVVLVSNATTRLEHDLEADGMLDAFDVVVNSSEVGVLKPAPGIYEVAAERAGVEPSRCLFVDDRKANVGGALAIDMPAVRFTSGARFEAILQRVGLLAR